MNQNGSDKKKGFKKYQKGERKQVKKFKKIKKEQKIKLRQGKMLKKSLGISRNKNEVYVQAKISQHKKKNRFKYVNKNDDSITQNQINSNVDDSLSQQTRNSSSSQKSYEHHTTCIQLCEQVKQLLVKVQDVKKQMALEAKSRYSSFKESETQKRDENICNLSKEAVKHILKAEKSLNVIRSMRGKNLMEDKYYRNMEMSLAQQIREASKDLRNQQKQYFERLKTYQKGTINNAIQLNTQQQQRMRGGGDFQMFITQQQTGQEDQKNMRIQQLVKSINQLTTVYRQLNELVIHQGSLIDRIDFNIQETFTHVQRANQHLENVDKKADSKHAARCIICLMSTIMILAVILGFKYSSSGTGH